MAPQKRAKRQNDILKVACDRSASRGTRRMALAELPNAKLSPEDAWDSVISHLDIFDDPDLAWFFEMFSYVLNRSQDAIEEPNPKTTANLLTVLSKLAEYITINGPSIIVQRGTSGTMRDIIRSFFSALSTDTSVGEAARPVVEAWMEHLPVIDYLRYSLEAVVESAGLGSDIVNRIKEIKYDEPKVLASLVDLTTTDPFALYLDTTQPPSKRRGGVVEALMAMHDTSNKKARDLKTTLLEHLQSAAVAMVNTPDIGWLADELWQLLQQRVDKIVEEHQAGEGLPEDVEWVADVLKACAVKEDVSLLQSKMLPCVANQKTLQFLKGAAGVEKYRGVLREWMKRSKYLGDMIWVFTAELMTDTTLLAELAPTLIENSFHDLQKLSAFSVTLPGIIESNPTPYVPFVGRLLDTYDPAASVAHVSNSILTAVSKGAPLAFSPHAERMFSLMEESKGLMGTASFMSLCTITKNLVEADHETVHSLPTLWDHLTRILNDPDRSPAFMYQFGPILAALAKPTESTALRVSTLLTTFIETHYPNHANDTNTQPSIRLLGELGSTHRSALEPAIPVLESILAPNSPASHDTQVTARPVVDNFKGLTLEALQEQVGQMGGIWKQLGFDPEDPLVGAIKGVDVGTVEKHDVMISYNWGTQKTVLRIYESLVKRGFSVWFDMEQMSGNVYGKMAEAVLGSSVIIPCLTAAYEASPNCKRELGFAADQARAGKKIVPVRLEPGPFTWSALITAGLLYTFIGEKEGSDEGAWEAAMDGLAREVRAALEGRQTSSVDVVDGYEGVDEGVVMERVEEGYEAVVREGVDEGAGVAGDVGDGSSVRDPPALAPPLPTEQDVTPITDTPSQIPSSTLTSILSRLTHLEHRLSPSSSDVAPDTTTPDSILTCLDLLETRMTALESKSEQRTAALWDFVARQADAISRLEKAVLSAKEE
ncbi:hypothetical protein HK104_000699 [Borealophlyctis nickersoniae]|nr:hypothetical protein HK104_000699 [Borealophlyctis nickersoniae]